MKQLKTIKYLDGLLFVSDEKPKENDTISDDVYVGRVTHIAQDAYNKSFIEMYLKEQPFDGYGKRIIEDGLLMSISKSNVVVAQTLNLSIPDVYYVEIGEVENNLDKLGQEFIESKGLHKQGYTGNLKMMFEGGYKAQSKRYSEEDILKAIAFGFGICRTHDRAPFNLEQREFLKSLTQPSLSNIESIEVKTEIVHDAGTIDDPEYHEIPVTYTKEGKTFLTISKISYKK